MRFTSIIATLSCIAALVNSRPIVDREDRVHNHAELSKRNDGEDALSSFTYGLCSGFVLTTMCCGYILTANRFSQIRKNLCNAIETQLAYDEDRDAQEDFVELSSNEDADLESQDQEPLLGQQSMQPLQVLETPRELEYVDSDGDYEVI